MTLRDKRTTQRLVPLTSSALPGGNPSAPELHNSKFTIHYFLVPTIHCQLSTVR